MTRTPQGTRYPEYKAVPRVGTTNRFARAYGVKHRINYCRDFKYVPYRPPVSPPKSVELRPLKSKKGRVIGYVSPDTGALFNTKHNPVEPVALKGIFTGWKRNSLYDTLRDAAAELGIHPDKDVSAIEAAAYLKLKGI